MEVLDLSSENEMIKFPIEPEKWLMIVNKIKGNYEDDDECTVEIQGAIDDIILSNKKLPFVPYPRAPVFSRDASVPEKLNTIQDFLNQLQYNHTGTQFFKVKMNRSISRLYEVAKDIIRNPFPIKCLEAVAISLYLTATINNIDRFTIRFKSQFGKTIHKHVVLGIHYNSSYGTIGLSRREALMFKPLKYKSLADLIFEFKESYSNCCHILKKVKLSLPITPGLHSCDTISWNHFVLSMMDMTEKEIKSVLLSYSRKLKTKFTTSTTL